VASAGEISIEAAIEQRQTTFKAMKGDVKKLKEAIQAGEPADSIAVREPAEQIVGHSKSLLGTFVADSYQGKTRAKKKIWKKWADFETRQNTLIIDAEQLLAASKTGSRAELNTAFKSLAKNCKGCHRHYRQIF
jgi:cytochrome c556